MLCCFHTRCTLVCKSEFYPYKLLIYYWLYRVLFFLIIGLLCGMAFCILYICCKYCKWRATSNMETNSEPRAGTNDIVERTTVEGSMVQRSLSTVQRVPIPLTLNNRNINVMKMEDVNKPSSNNSSNTTINDAPPPYPIDSEKPPPSYSEIDLWTQSLATLCTSSDLCSYILLLYVL